MIPRSKAQKTRDSHTYKNRHRALIVQERMEITFGLGVGRIWAGSLQEVVLELSLESKMDWCSRDGG